MKILVPQQVVMTHRPQYSLFCRMTTGNFKMPQNSSTCCKGFLKSPQGQELLSYSTFEIVFNLKAERERSLNMKGDKNLHFIHLKWTETELVEKLVSTTSHIDAN